jgi:hypothetical protein
MARKHTYVDFTKEPNVPLFAKTTGAVATAVNDQEDYFRTSNGSYFELCQNLASTAMAAGFQAGTTGWLVASDGAAEGLEITQGILSGNDMSFVVGTDAFFVQATFKTTTIANSLLYGVGFRKQGAYEAAFSDAASHLTAYDDKAWVGTTVADGTMTSHFSKATTDTSTAATHAVVAATTWCCLRVDVAASGAVTFKIGTSLVSQAAAEAALAVDTALKAVTDVVATGTMTSGVTVIPYISHVGTVAGTGDLRVLKYICGLA